MPKQYRLPYTLKAPSEETEDRYLAEVPVLPGCRAWGATAEEALLNLEGVAADFSLHPVTTMATSCLLLSPEPASSWSRFDLSGTGRKLRALGCEFDRQSRGPHEIWRNSATGARTTIPNWGGRDLRAGTIGAIIRDLRVDREAFERA